MRLLHDDKCAQILREIAGQGRKATPLRMLILKRDKVFWFIESAWLILKVVRGRHREADISASGSPRVRLW